MDDVLLAVGYIATMFALVAMWIATLATGGHPALGVLATMLWLSGLTVGEMRGRYDD